MRLLAILITAISLAAGVLGAATSYTPPLSLPDSALTGSTLGAPAGIGERAIPAGTVLTPELLADLRQQGIARVRVKSFSFNRWTGRWGFAGACVGLALGAVLFRRAAARSASASADGPRSTPLQALDRLIQSVRELRLELASLPDDHTRLRTMMDQLDTAQRSHWDDLLRTRDQIMRARGMSGYARFMGPFAAAERRLARAWSTAADGYSEDASQALDEGLRLLEQARQRLSP